MAWVHAVMDAPAGSHAQLAEFWSAVLGWRLGDPWPGHPELQSYEPPRGAAYVHLQRIEGEPRIHLDVEAVDPDGMVDRAGELGGELTAVADRWRSMSSPGGLPFCVVPAKDHEPPGPITWPDHHRSRMVQVCIDSPAAVHEREVTFWRALLGARSVSSPAREFAGKWHDDAGSPLQLLFQRLDEPEGVVRAHLDHGTDDIRAEVRRVQGLGAQDIGPGRGWHALRDPAGMAFCITGNSPEQTRRRDLG